MNDEKGRVVECEIEIDAPVAVVWRAITDARELECWFPMSAEVDRAAGTIRLRWGDAYESIGGIEAWDPERHLRHRFPRVGETHLATDWFLEGRGGRTVVRVVSSGFGAGTDWDESYDGVASGWDFELYSLRHYLERHRGEDRRVVLRVCEAGASAPDAWLALTGPLGLFEGGLAVRASEWWGVAGGVALSGPVLRQDPPVRFSGRVTELNDGLLRIGLEPRDGTSRAWVQLSAWGAVGGDLDALEAAWSRTLRERLPVGQRERPSLSATP